MAEVDAWAMRFSYGDHSDWCSKTGCFWHRSSLEMETRCAIGLGGRRVRDRALQVMNVDEALR
jgi:hypothetical protein